MLDVQCHVISEIYFTFVMSYVMCDVDVWLVTCVICHRVYPLYFFSQPPSSAQVARKVKISIHPNADKVTKANPSSSHHGIHQHNTIDYHEINTFSISPYTQLGYTPARISSKYEYFILWREYNENSCFNQKSKISK